MKNIGYYTHYQKNILPVSSLEVNNLTHIIHDCIWVKSDGSLYTPNNFIDLTLNAKVHAAGKSILICFGDDGTGHAPNSNMSAVIADASLRAAFINNILNFITVNKYDGVDFDWASPTAQDRSNFVVFIKQLRAAFNAVNSDLLITLAITGDSYTDTTYYDLIGLDPSINWYNVMCYDIHGSWIKHIGYNAPLYPGSDNHGCGSVDSYITYLSSVVAPSKLVLLMPFYGLLFVGGHNYLGTYSSVSQINYNALQAELNKGGYVASIDVASGVPYYVNIAFNSFISFDDTRSLGLKIQYAINKGLGGVGIWSLDKDVMGDGTQPLLEFIGKTLAASSPVNPIPPTPQISTIFGGSSFQVLPVYASQTAAAQAKLLPGTVYQTSTGEVRIVTPY